MPFCAKCGASVDPNVAYCASCGSPVGIASSSTPGAASPMYSTMNQAQQMSRPTGVTILAILDIIGGLALLGFGAIVAVGASILGGGAGALAAGLGALMVIFALISFAVAYAFWTGQTWGWWLGIVAAILDIISIAFSLNVFGLIIGIIMLYYLTRQNVKAWFHKA